MIYLKAFIAGFVSTLVFHQGVLWLLYAVGFSPLAPWNMTPVPPLNIPAVISLAFWGGLWGILLWALIGALAPSLVAWFVVMPMKGMGLGGGWDPKIIVSGLLPDGGWGLGTALLIRLLTRVNVSSGKSQ